MIWLSPGEAARLANVTPKTLTRWAARGLVQVQRTAGGQRRYERDSVMTAKATAAELRAELSSTDALGEEPVSAADVASVAG